MFEVVFALIEGSMSPEEAENLIPGKMHRLHEMLAEYKRVKRRTHHVYDYLLKQGLDPSEWRYIILDSRFNAEYEAAVYKAAMAAAVALPKLDPYFDRVIARTLLNAEIMKLHDSGISHEDAFEHVGLRDEYVETVGIALRNNKAAVTAKLIGYDLVEIA
jgi:hypothetical protein